MRVLVVGSGAREHALCLRLSASPHVTGVICTPGNAGIAATVQCETILADDVPGLVELASRLGVGLVVAGGEAALVAGLADALLGVNIPCFGPTAAGAELEGSKAFAKAFMARHGVPTAPFASFTDPTAAEAYIRAAPSALVVKASGLAAGKGVFVCNTTDEAVTAANSLLRGHALGRAGTTVVIEARLPGDEVSFHVVTDGKRYVVVGGAQDHKRLLDGDLGPNTGGMGAYAPVPLLTAALTRKVCDSIVEPTLAGLALEGRPFRGALFVGLMVHHGVPRVLEYNVRFGDPECAVLLARTHGDWFPLLLGAATGDLRRAPVPVDRGASAGVVVASQGYPDAPRHGDVIHGLAAAGTLPGVTVLHGATRVKDGQVVSAGGRVLLVTAVGDHLAEALSRAYRAVDTVSFSGAQARRDIGARARPQ